MKKIVDGEIHESARVEVSLLGPSWTPLMRFRFYMESNPKDHLTVWKVYKLSNWIGTYTPPGWFLRLIGQAE